MSDCKTNGVHLGSPVVPLENMRYAGEFFVAGRGDTGAVVRERASSIISSKVPNPQSSDQEREYFSTAMFPAIETNLNVGNS